MVQIMIMIRMVLAHPREVGALQHVLLHRQQLEHINFPQMWAKGVGQVGKIPTFPVFFFMESIPYHHHHGRCSA